MSPEMTVFDFIPSSADDGTLRGSPAGVFFDLLGRPGLLARGAGAFHCLKPFHCMTVKSRRSWVQEARDMANEDEKDFNAMLLRDNGMPRVQIVTDPKAIEPYGKTRMCLSPPRDYDRTCVGPPSGRRSPWGISGTILPRGAARVLPTPPPRAFSSPSPPGPATSGPGWRPRGIPSSAGGIPTPLVCSRRSDASLPSARRENAPAHSWAGGSAGADAAGGAARFFLRRRHTARTTAAAAASTSRAIR